MDLFVANCTKQIQSFSFRVTETGRLVTQTIPVGGQIKVAGDLNTPDIDAIVKHHARYGMVSVDEIDRTKPFTGTCYSDREIPIDAILAGIAHNTGVLVALGKEIRKATAVTINENYEKNLEQNVGRDAELKRLNVTVQQEEPAAGYSAESAPVGEGYVIDRNVKPD